MPRDASALEWWEDPDLDEVRRRIERRRAEEGRLALLVAPRGVREISATSRALLLSSEARPSRPFRGGSRTLRNLSSHPDRVAAWAVVLCLVLLFTAIVTSHG